MLFGIERSEFPKKIRAMALSPEEAVELIDEMFGPAAESKAYPIDDNQLKAEES